MSWHKEVFDGEDMKIKCFQTTREVNFYDKGYADGYNEARKGELGFLIWTLLYGVGMGVIITLFILSILK